MGSWNLEVRVEGAKTRAGLAAFFAFAEPCFFLGGVTGALTGAVNALTGMQDWGHVCAGSRLASNTTGASLGLCLWTRGDWM